MEKKTDNMLTEDQKRRIVVETQRFVELASKFIRKEAELSECEKSIAARTEELFRVAEEERQLEAAVEALYLAPKEKGKAKEIKETLEKLEKNREALRSEIDQLRTDLLKQMRNLPVPVDLDNPQKEESAVAFEYFDEARLGEESIRTMSMLFRQEYPPKFEEIVLLPDKVVVKNASEKPEALSKLIKGIQSFRMVVDNLSKSYERIDEMVERVKRSELYSAVLKVLFKEPKLSPEEIATRLNMDKRKVYDTCYNLTRSNWSPSPIKFTPSGEWELTLPGEILVNRLRQKYPEQFSAASSESKVPNNEKQSKEN